MGGHAFKSLNCPRISPEIYTNVKLHTTAALRTIFSHVVVPTEMPEKDDYGDIDFLVSSPLHSPTSTSVERFDWPGTVSLIKSAFNTTHGRLGFLSLECMYFAIRAPGHEEKDFWVQVDVKVCFKPELFEWQSYELGYATLSKIKGSMVKPLGLTIDPEGLHIRVEEMDETNFPGSMIWISNSPKDVLRIMGMDRRQLEATFQTKDEIYKYIAGSWLFNPAHFAGRLVDEGYTKHLDNRSAPWTHFIKEWIPGRYPGYRFVSDAPNSSDSGSNLDQLDSELREWNKVTRAAIREKVFTMFPHIATAYYIKRAAYTNGLEEQRLRTLIMNAISKGDAGWIDNFPQPRIIVRHPEVCHATPKLTASAPGELTPPMMPGDKVFTKEVVLPDFTLLSPAPPSQPPGPEDVPIYLDALPREPPYTCKPSPPPSNMGEDKKVLCLARWTLFDPTNGKPSLLSSPRDKDFEMQWTDATYAGATDEVLVKWARDMWWSIWIRQCHTNYVGLWKTRFAKEDKKAEGMRVEEEEAKRKAEEAKLKAEEMVKANRVKLLGRLKVLNRSLGLVDETATAN